MMRLSSGSSRLNAATVAGASFSSNRPAKRKSPETSSSTKALACDADQGGRAGSAGAAGRHTVWDRERSLPPAEPAEALACDADQGGRAGSAGAAGRHTVWDRERSLPPAEMARVEPT